MKKVIGDISLAVRTNAWVGIGALCCVFCFGLIVGFFIERYVSIRREADAVFGFQKIHPLNNNSEFTNPLLGFDSSEKTQSEYTQLEKRIQIFISDGTIRRYVDNISVYFRNINNGEWVGINENEDFNPASLLKVPVMMFYLKLAESDPSVLSRTYAYTASDMNLLKSVQGNDLTTRLMRNKLYTVDTLIEEMIVRSDNIAKYLLILNSPQNDLDNIYADLGVQIHKEEGNRYTISARTYSLFFRTLYNVTFLNQKMSEKALAMLRGTEFNDGLVVGVPTHIKVAHKFGQYTNMEKNGAVASVEAHDCGIIYYPDSPYVLCVMTQGKDTKQLEEIIQQISRITYEFVDEHKGQ